MTSGRVGAAVIAQAGLELQYNGYLVFDYLDGSNYKYAGMDGTGQRWVIREVVSGTDTLRAGVAGTIVKGTLYDVEVQVSGNLATLKVGGVVKMSYTFDGIQGGQVGLRIAQAHTDFLEALALISDLAAIYYPNWDGYLSEMSSIFLGTDLYGPGTLIAALAAGGCGGIGREQHDCMATEHYFLDKGFHPDFQDGHNQPYHAWAYVAQTAAPGSPAAYTTGRLMGIVANTVHEPLQSRLGMVDGWGTSWQDYVLS